MKENAIERYLRNQAKTYNCLVYKFTSPANRGVPDDIIVLPGGAVHFLEIKQTNGKLSPLQEYHINALREKGCQVFTLYGKQGVDDYFDAHVPA